MRFSTLLSYCVFIVVTSSCAVQAVNISSDFDSDLDGWSYEGSGNLYHVSQGGNLNGYIQYADVSGAGGDGWIIAPDKFCGDWTTLDGNGVLSWDHNILQPGGVSSILQAQAIIAGPGGSARFTASDYMAEYWKEFSAPITEDAWLLTSGTWQGLISNVAQLKIRIEAVWNDSSPLDIDGIDNVALKSVPKSQVIDFESLHPGYETSYIQIPNGYEGFNWSFYFRGITSQEYPASGYENGTTGTMAAYTSGHKHVSMSSSDGETFTFIGADITAAWLENEPVTVEGWRQGELIYTEEIHTSPDGPYWFDFYYHDVDTIWFKPITESGNHHIVIDNINVEFVNINDQLAQLDFDNATLDDIIALFGEPIEYIWGNQIFTRDNLPDVYIARYPNDFGIVMVRGAIDEIRFESAESGYIFKNQIQVGSSLEKVLSVIGQPTEIVTGQPCGWQDGVLYKDINGIAGYCYYLRADQNVRMFFWDYQVKAIYVLGNVDEPSTPLDIAVNHIEQSITKKVESLETTYSALQKEQAAYDALEGILRSGDFGDLKKGDIVQSMQKIHSAIQHLEQSMNALQKSIEKLEDALHALGVVQVES